MEGVLLSKTNVLLLINGAFRTVKKSGTSSISIAMFKPNDKLCSTPSWSQCFNESEQTSLSGVSSVLLHGCLFASPSLQHGSPVIAACLSEFIYKTFTCNQSKFIFPIHRLIWIYILYIFFYLFFNGSPFGPKNSYNTQTVTVIEFIFCRNLLIIFNVCVVCWILLG